MWLPSSVRFAIIRANSGSAVSSLRGISPTIIRFTISVLARAWIPLMMSATLNHSSVASATKALANCSLIVYPLECAGHEADIEAILDRSLQKVQRADRAHHRKNHTPLVVVPLP